MVKKIKNFKTFADKKNKGKLSVKPQPRNNVAVRYW
jgi:hypothetical protein